MEADGLAPEQHALWREERARLRSEVHARVQARLRREEGAAAAQAPGGTPPRAAAGAATQRQVSERMLHAITNHATAMPDWLLSGAVRGAHDAEAEAKAFGFAPTRTVLRRSCG